MPANFLSQTNIDDDTEAKNAKAIAAAIDPFTPTLAEEQAVDPEMVKFKQFFVKKLGHWALLNHTNNVFCLYWIKFLPEMALFGLD